MENEGKDVRGVVLLVEDDVTLMRLYEEKFKIEGYKVLTAVNGESGLEMALNSQFDIMLLDLGLPKLSGLEVLKKFRDSPIGKEVPVIVLTNEVKEKDRSMAFAMNAKEYLVKAMQTPEQVVEKVKEHIHSK